MKDIRTIVITGGPCGGKSTAMSRIMKEMNKLGYTVLFVAETASELINGGITPTNCVSNAEFQKCLFDLQLSKEKTFMRAAQKMEGEKCIIVYDRGALDNKAYMSKEEFAEVMDYLGMDEVQLRDNYDAVFHLVTAAEGAESFYTLANNQARTETPAQARAIDKRIISAWTGHPHLRVIDNSTDFEGKMQRLIAEIAAFLGEPEPLRRLPDGLFYIVPREHVGSHDVHGAAGLCDFFHMSLRLLFCPGKPGIASRIHYSRHRAGFQVRGEKTSCFPPCFYRDSMVE